jgi:hypothetical protein
VLRDGHGTCTSKHATFVTVAAEADLAVTLVWGVYALDEQIVAGAGEVLAAHGLPFVPTVHCLLRIGDAHVDLTEGNCTGKRRLPVDYLHLVEAAVGADDGPLRRAVAARLCATHPGFAGRTPDELAGALAECEARLRHTCVTVTGL